VSPIELALPGALEARLGAHGFVRREHPAQVEGVSWGGLWARKTWNTNRAAALLRLPPGGHPGQLSRRLALPVGRVAGYLTFLYPVGLQLVWVGRGCHRDDLATYVDAIDTQRSVLQSIFVLDLDGPRTCQARTWGQVITGKFQDAIQQALDDVVDAAS
jgi:hypothetical protein